MFGILVESKSFKRHKKNPPTHPTSLFPNVINQPNSLNCRSTFDDRVLCNRKIYKFRSKGVLSIVKLVYRIYIYIKFEKKR